MFGSYLSITTVTMASIVLLTNFIMLIKLTSHRKLTSPRNFALFSMCGYNIATAIGTASRPLLTLLDIPTAKYHLQDVWRYGTTYLPVFAIVNTVIHISLLVYFTGKLLTLSEERYSEEWRLRPRDSALISACICCLSLAPLPAVLQPEWQPPFAMSTAASLGAVNIVFLLSSYYLLRSVRRVRKTSREQFLFNDIISKQKRERRRKKMVRVTIGLIVSFSACSYPYMVYFALQYADSIVAVVEERRGLVERLLLLSVLVKCLCDSMVYLVVSGCRRRYRKPATSYTFVFLDEQLQSTLSVSTRESELL